jgi:threonine synthase
MDVGAPSNFARILDLYESLHEKISQLIKGFRYTDEEIREVVKNVYNQYGYLCDPHGACGFEALNEYLIENQVGVFLETAHPAKFKETVEEIIQPEKIELPTKLEEFLKGEKHSISLDKSYNQFKDYLLQSI